VLRIRLISTWLPLILSAAAVFGAAALGVEQSQSPLSVAQVISATSAAQSARFTSVSVVSSPSPDLRSKSSATGAVSFATGNGSSVETDRSVGYSSEGTGPWVPDVEVTTTEQRVLRGRAYTELSVLSTPGPVPVWVKLPAAPGAKRGVLGSLNTLNPSAVGLLSAPNADLKLQAAGTATVERVPVSAYRIEFTATKAAACAAGLPLNQSGRPTLTTEVWVDGQNRLRQIQTSMTLTIPRRRGGPAGLPADATVAGTAVDVTTLRLGSFGQPVHVVAPLIQSLHEAYSSATLVATCNGKSHR
jgi:hypothetical protein